MSWMFFSPFSPKQQVGEIGFEMVPLRFRKTRPIHIECGTKNIDFFREEHHTSHPSSDGNDVLLSEIYGEFRDVQKFCYLYLFLFFL